MFKRELHVKMTKPNKEAPPTKVDENKFLEHLYDLEVFTERVAIKVAKGVAAYIVLDTLRRVAVILAEKQ